MFLVFSLHVRETSATIDEVLVHSRRKFSQLVSNHVFCYRDIEVVFTVMDLEPQTDEVW